MDEVFKPETMTEVVRRSLRTKRSFAHLRFGSHNAEYATKWKAEEHLPSYLEFLGATDLLAWQEVDRSFLTVLEAAAPKAVEIFCTQENDRGQSVGFTVALDRLEVLDVVHYRQIIGVRGVGNLRPALRLDLRDKDTGLVFTAVGLHLKSMSDGCIASSKVRRRQAEILADLLAGVQHMTIALGDLNQILEKTTDLEPLLRAGFVLLPRHDQSPTQLHGARIDGLVAKNIPTGVSIGGYRVWKFWRNTQSGGAALSDHALLRWSIRQRCH